MTRRLSRPRIAEFLEAAAAWYEKNLDCLRPQDVVSLIITLATVNYSPTNADTLIPVSGTETVGSTRRPTPAAAVRQSMVVHTTYFCIYSVKSVKALHLFIGIR